MNKALFVVGKAGAAQSGQQDPRVALFDPRTHHGEQQEINHGI